jgi:pimeloyl-ACP methyl ester carboxylesterase
MTRFTNAKLACLALLSALGCAEEIDASTNSATRAAETQTADVGPASSAAISRTKIVLGDLTFDALTAGSVDGTPVILLHGFPETSREWISQIAALAQAGYRAVAPDQRGYSPGARPAAVSAYATSELVKDVLGIADALGFTRFHLVGHDWGASVAWATALSAPHRLLSLTPISVPHPGAFAQTLADPTSCQPRASSYFSLFVSPTAEQTLRGNDNAFLRNVYSGLPKASVDEYLTIFSGPALTGGLNWYRANLAPTPGSSGTPRPAAGPCTVPTMYIWSDGDTALCRDSAVLTEKFVTGPYRFEIVQGVGHWVPELAADRVNSLLLEHLAQYTASKR